jgi:hypothetical protein
MRAFNMVFYLMKKDSMMKNEELNLETNRENEGQIME